MCLFELCDIMPKKSKRYGVIAIWVSVVLYMCVLPTANATLFFFEYSGRLSTVSFVRGASDTYGMTIGDQVTGAFTVEASVRDQNPDPNQFFFPNAVHSIGFNQFGASGVGLSYSYLYVDVNPKADHVAVYANVLYGNISDVYQFTLSEPGAESVLSGFSFDFASLSLPYFDRSGNSFSFQRAVFSGNQLPEITQFYVQLESLSISAVSEPDTAILMLVGFLGAAIRSPARRKFTGRHRRALNGSNISF